MLIWTLIIIRKGFMEQLSQQSYNESWSASLDQCSTSLHKATMRVDLLHLINVQHHYTKLQWEFICFTWSTFNITTQSYNESSPASLDQCSTSLHKATMRVDLLHLINVQHHYTATNHTTNILSLPLLLLLLFLLLLLLFLTLSQIQIPEGIKY